MKYYQTLLAKYAETTLREKFLILGTGLFVVLFGGYSGIVEPELVKLDQLKQRQQSSRAEIEPLQQQINDVLELLDKDPDEPLRAQIAQSKEDIVELDGQLKDLTVDLIPAKDMPRVLERVLSSMRKVKVVDMASIPAKKMLKAQGAGAEVDLYQHGVQLTLEGEYFDIQKYLEHVESLEWQFYWKTFDYRVKKSPIGVMTLEIYTLSTSEKFIGV